MIDFALVAERLRTAGVPRVLGVLEYSALSSAPTILPAHYLTPLDEDAAANRYAGGGGIIDQRVNVRFQVVSIVAASAARVERPSEDLTAEIARVKTALIGWSIPGCSMPTEYAGGRLLSAGGREAVWAIRFRTAYHERTPVQ